MVFRGNRLLVGWIIEDITKPDMQQSPVSLPTRQMKKYLLFDLDDTLTEKALTFYRERFGSVILVYNATSRLSMEANLTELEMIRRA